MLDQTGVKSCVQVLTTQSLWSMGDGTLPYSVVEYTVSECCPLIYRLHGLQSLLQWKVDKKAPKLSSEGNVLIYEPSLPVTHMHTHKYMPTSHTHTLNTQILCGYCSRRTSLVCVSLAPCTTSSMCGTSTPSLPSSGQRHSTRCYGNTQLHLVHQPK